MDESTLKPMLKRLDRLERENRRFKYMAGGILVSISALLIMGQARPVTVSEIIEAKAFVLRDIDGKERARLAVDKTAAAFRLFNSEGIERVKLTIQEDTTGQLGKLTLSGSQQKLGSTAELTSASLEVKATDPTRTVNVRVVPGFVSTSWDDTAEMMNRFAALSAIPSMLTGVVVNDQSKNSMTLGLENDGVRLRMKGGNEEQLLNLGIGKNSTGLYLKDPKSYAELALIAQEGKGLITIRGGDKKFLFSAP